MKHLLAIATLLFFLITQNASAQYAQDINGRPITVSTDTEVEGSPFLNADWVKGAIKLTDGRTYNDVPLKYNEVYDELLFQDKSGQILTFVDPVKEFRLSYSVNNIKVDALFRNGFKDIPNTTEKSFFEVLSDGTATLLKRSTKSISETKEYNGPLVKKFEESVKYYLIVAGKPMPLKKDKKFVLTTLGNKQTELEAYIKANNLNIKNDSDLAKLINYYNSL